MNIKTFKDFKYKFFYALLILSMQSERHRYIEAKLPMVQPDCQTAKENPQISCPEELQEPAESLQEPSHLPRRKGDV